MSNLININAHSTIEIEGHKFISDDNGMWNLTDIWKTLGLPGNKRPSQWDNREAKALRHSVEISTLKVGKVSQVFGSKFATLQYAGWVSFDFSRMVYAAFEAILATPEVAAIIAIKMEQLGHVAAAEQMERIISANADRDYAHDEMKHWRDRMTNKDRCKAVLAGTITLQQAINQGLKGVWLDRCKAAMEAVGDF